MKVASDRPVPALPVTTSDRSLQGYNAILTDLVQQTKSVMNPEIQQQLWTLINPFRQQLVNILQKHKEAGKGFSNRYSPQLNYLR